MKSSQYAAIFNNEAVLTNAVQFTTAHRTFVAGLIPLENLDELSQQTLDFFALHAFSEFMTATEDLLGWVAVLKEWDLDDDYSLFKLLDKVQVKPALESEVIEYLEGLDSNSSRSLLRVPSDSELISRGLSDSDVIAVSKSIPAKIDGLLKIAQIRAKEDRGLVKGFNKIKHMVLAFPINEPDGHRILLPKIKKSRTRFSREPRKDYD